ncbi:hypothetical protein DY000_02017533 [Brassica cretica]|uniref:Uncharacterized protein n=1 Tax=Brassica cretica TaxID=69181 RepID=A0ABQ7D2U6_BRACR|nr:hypothetical protein DY000_02017533 [Brassica cretica]
MELEAGGGVFSREDYDGLIKLQTFSFAPARALMRPLKHHEVAIAQIKYSAKGTEAATLRRDQFSSFVAIFLSEEETEATSSSDLNSCALGGDDYQFVGLNLGFCLENSSTCPPPSSANNQSEATQGQAASVIDMLQHWTIRSNSISFHMEFSDLFSLKAPHCTTRELQRYELPAREELVENSPSSRIFCYIDISKTRSMVKPDTVLAESIAPCDFVKK